MIILSHPSGNQNVRAAVRALDRAGLLATFCTTVAWRRNNVISGLLPPSIRAELGRRAFDEIDPHRIATFPGREIVRQLALRGGFTALTKHEAGWASIDQVYRTFDNQVARLIINQQTASAVYAYDDGALQTFEAARRAGLRRIYELPIGYWRTGQRLMTEERDLQSDWAPTIGGLRDSAAKLERKDAELELANHIIVPSDFVRETLREHPSLTGTIDVVPYGAPTPMAVSRTTDRRSEKLRLLFVGSLSQRKGISYLFQAMRHLNGIASLSLIGSMPDVDCSALSAALERHRWLGTMPHNRVLDAMAQHDVLVFPSLFEGFGLVILEAMSQGLPVITTPNTAGPMVIDDGEDGFVVPIRNADAIVDRVTQLAEDRDLLEAVSEAARRKAQIMSWSRYEEQLLHVIGERLH